MNAITQLELQSFMVSFKLNFSKKDGIPRPKFDCIDFIISFKVETSELKLKRVDRDLIVLTWRDTLNKSN